MKRSPEKFGERGSFIEGREIGTEKEKLKRLAVEVASKMYGEQSVDCSDAKNVIRKRSTRPDTVYSLL